MLLSTPASLVLRDVSRDGRVLITTEAQRVRLLFRGPADQRERELSWLDWSLISDLSLDGKYVAFFESGEGAGAVQRSYLRETNGAPAVFLGNGARPELSPDGQSVVVYQVDPPSITIYPVGAGQAQQIAVPGFTLALAGLMSDAKHVWFNGNEPSPGRRYYITDLQGTKPQPVTPEGVQGVSPGLVLNGKYLAGLAGGKLRLYPVDGGKSETPASIREGERIAGSSRDGKSLFVYSVNEFPFKAYRLDRFSGKRDLLLEATPADRAGAISGGGMFITPDARSCS